MLRKHREKRKYQPVREQEILGSDKEGVWPPSVHSITRVVVDGYVHPLGMVACLEVFCNFHCVLLRHIFHLGIEDFPVSVVVIHFLS